MLVWCWGSLTVFTECSIYNPAYIPNTVIWLVKCVFKCALEIKCTLVDFIKTENQGGSSAASLVHAQEHTCMYWTHKLDFKYTCKYTYICTRQLIWVNERWIQRGLREGAFPPILCCASQWLSILLILEGSKRKHTHTHSHTYTVSLKHTYKYRLTNTHTQTQYAQTQRPPHIHCHTNTV